METKDIYFRPSSPILNDENSAQNTPTMTKRMTKKGTPTTTSKSTSNGIQPAIDYINHALSAYGFTSDLTIYKAGKAETAKVVGCILSLLQSRQRDLEFRNDMNSRLTRLSSENDTLQLDLKTTKNKLEISDREFDGIKLKLDKAITNFKESSKECTSLKEELKALKSQLNYIRNHFLHDTRKREKEFNKLKDRVTKGMNEELKSSGVIFKCINPVSSFQSASLRKQQQPEGIYDIVIGNFELRQNELVAENQALRRTLYNAYSLLHSLVKNISNEAEINEQPEALFYFPFDQISDSVEEHVAEVAHLLQQSLEHSTFLSNAKKDLELKHQTELENLKAQIDDYKKIIEEQGRLIELSLNPEFQQRPLLNEPGDPDIVEITRKELENEKLACIEKQKKLDDERRAFTNAAIKLGKERALLEEEMEAFKDLKRKNETSTLLSQLPETPVWLKKSFAELNVHDTDTKSDPITPARRQQDRSSEFDSLSTPAAIRIIDGTTISPIEATVSQMYTTEYSKEKYSLKSKNQPSFLRSTPITRSLMKSSGEDGLKQSQNGSVKKEVRISEENEYFESPDRFEEPK